MQTYRTRPQVTVEHHPGSEDTWLRFQGEATQEDSGFVAHLVEAAVTRARSDSTLRIATVLESNRASSGMVLGALQRCELRGDGTLRMRRAGATIMAEFVLRSDGEEPRSSDRTGHLGHQLSVERTTLGAAG